MMKNEELLQHKKPSPMRDKISMGDTIFINDDHSVRALQGSPVRVEGGKIYRSLILKGSEPVSLSEVFVPDSFQGASMQEESQSLSTLDFRKYDVNAYYLKSSRDVTLQIGNSCRTIPLKEAMELARWIISKS